MTNKTCPHCGVETSGMMTKFGELHLPDCPMAEAHALGETIAAAISAAIQSANDEDGPSINDRMVLLDEAEATINGPRARDYGDVTDNFGRIAAGWSQILGVHVSLAQVALCMDWVKTCRLITSPDHRDSWIDKLGYSALGGEVSGK